jgi:hypothetical protein
MKGSTIGPLNVPPNGVFGEGIITDTSLPGTILEIIPNLPLVNGRHQLRASARASGKDRAQLVLLEDNAQGGNVTTAYVAGTYGRYYIPTPGEELNVLVEVPGTGTGSHGGVQQGEFLINDTSGHLTPETGSPESTPWQALENVADVNPPVAQLTWCRYNG